MECQKEQTAYQDQKQGGWLVLNAQQRRYFIDQPSKNREHKEDLKDGDPQYGILFPDLFLAYQKKNQNQQKNGKNDTQNLNRHDRVWIHFFPPKMKFTKMVSKTLTR